MYEINCTRAIGTCYAGVTSVMLYVRTRVGPSSIQGLGLFADQVISKGTRIWKFTVGFDQRFTREQLMAFPESVQDYLAKYAWLSSKSRLYCLASDNGKYFNHSKHPNVRSDYIAQDEEVITTAIRDIQVGEEMTDDYSTFESSDDETNVLFEIARRRNLVEDFDYR